MIRCKRVTFSSVRRIGRVVVFALLAWTAFDVLNPAFCGLDERPFVANAATTLAGDLPVDSPVPAEDCFCCSHTVRMTAATVVVSILPHAAERRIDVERTPRWTSFPLYHPPRPAQLI